MDDKLDGLFTFYSWNHAIRAEKVLEERGFQVALIPVPRELSSNCGTSLRFKYARKAEAEEMLDASRVHFEAAYPYVPELEITGGEESATRQRTSNWLAALLRVG